MKRIGLMVLTLVAASALSGAMSSTSQAAACLRTSEAGKGNWNNSICTEKAAGEKNYIKVKKLTSSLGGGLWCAETLEANTGNATTSICTTSGVGNFIKVFPYQRWQVNGGAEPNAKQPIKLQLKGQAKLSVPKLELKIECATSASEGATIEGQGKNHSGQDKGSIKYTKCVVASPAGCTVTEPITTHQTKSYLAISENNTAKEARPVDVFEPTEGKTFTAITTNGASCPATVKGTFNVNGSVAAEIGPEGAEVKEGDLQFPEEAIKTVKTPNGESELGLTFGGTGLPSTFSAGYGAQLESGEMFGVGG